MGRPKHPKKEVEKAIAFAISRGWTFEPRKGKGHAWGRLLCPETQADRQDSVWVWSTPQNSGNHAKQIRQAVGRCPHGEQD